MIDGQGVTELFMISVKYENLIFVVLGMVAPRLPTVRKKNTQNNKTIIIYDRHYENSAASNKLYVAKSGRSFQTLVVLKISSKSNVRRVFANSRQMCRFCIYLQICHKKVTINEQKMLQKANNQILQQSRHVNIGS